MLVPAERTRDRHFLLDRVRAGERIPAFDAVHRRKDGSPVTISLSMSPIHDRHGQVVAVAGIAHDITETRRLESNLRQSAKMEAVGRLAGGLAHDFNNMLTVIDGYSELVLMKLPADSPVARARGGDPQGRRAGRRADPAADGVQPQVDGRAARPGSQRGRAGRRRHAEARDRRGHRHRDQAGRRPRSRDGGSGAVRSDAGEPGHQRARRDAQRRPGDHRDRQRQLHRRARRGPARGAARHLRDARRLRHRRRHGRRDAQPGVRAVLHHQGQRPRHRPRPDDAAELRDAERRLRRRVQRARPGHHVQDLPADRGPAGGGDAHAPLGRASRPAPKPSSSSRTTMRCGTSRKRC